MRSKSDKMMVAAKKRGYTADRKGRVFKPDGKEVLGSKLPNSDHLRITMYADGVNDRGFCSVLKHRFVAYFFFGDEVFSHDVVRHLNDIGNDNRLENIALGSYKDNRADIPRSKISEPAKKHAHKLVARSRKLSDHQVLSMRKDRIETGLSYKALAEKYGVTTMTAYRAINKQSWRLVND